MGGLAMFFDLPQPKGVCVHLTTDNMCEIHATKPQQCCREGKDANT